MTSATTTPTTPSETPPTLRPIVSSAATVFAACGGIVVVVMAFAGEMGGPFFSDDTPAQIVAWVQAHPTTLAVEGTEVGLSMTLMAVLLSRLALLAGGSWLLVLLSIGAVVADAGVDWGAAGAYYGLADAGTRGGSGSVLALFSLVRQLTFSDGFLVGIAMTGVGILCLRAGVLPRVLAWFAVAEGAFHIVELPLQLALNGRVDGVTGPVGALSSMAWVLAVSLVLLAGVLRGRRRTA